MKKLLISLLIIVNSVYSMDKILNEKVYYALKFTSVWTGGKSLLDMVRSFSDEEMQYMGLNLSSKNLPTKARFLLFTRGTAYQVVAVYFWMLGDKFKDQKLRLKLRGEK